MIQFKDVPYRQWRNGYLEETKVGKRVMHQMGKALDAGKAVDFVQSQPMTTAPILKEGFAAGVGGAYALEGKTYDTITLTITD